MGRTKREAQSSQMSKEVKEKVKWVRAKCRAKIEAEAEKNKVSKFVNPADALNLSHYSDDSDVESTDTDNRADSACSSGKRRRGRKRRKAQKRPTTAADGASSSSTAPGRRPACSPDYELKVHMQEMINDEENSGNPIFGCAFNPYQKGPECTLATVGLTKISIYAYDGTSDDMELIQVYADTNETENYYSVIWLYDKFSDIAMIAAAGFSGIVKIINVTKGDYATCLRAHTHAINDMAAHPTLSTVFATASKDFSLRLLEAVSGQCLAIFGGDLGHTDEVLSVDFDIDGSKMLSSGMDHAVKIWDLKGNANIQNAIATARFYRQWRAKKKFRSAVVGVPLFSNREIHNHYVDCVRSFGDLVISKSCKNEMALWMPEQMRMLKAGTIHNPIRLNRRYEMKDNSVWFVKVALDPDFRRMACGNTRGVIYLWDLHKEKINSRPTYITAPSLTRTVRQVCFSPDGKHLCGVTDDSGIWLFSKKTNQSGLKKRKKEASD